MVKLLVAFWKLLSTMKISMYIKTVLSYTKKRKLLAGQAKPKITKSWGKKT
jgi:hypothetical protein